MKEKVTGIVFKKTEKVNMGWSKIIRLGIILLWKLCELEKMNRFARRIKNPPRIEFFGSKVGAEYVGTQNALHFFKDEKPAWTKYNEDSEQTKWRKSSSLSGIFQLIFKELEKLGIKI